MSKVAEEVKKQFGGKVRIRACGVLKKDATVLLVKHLGVGSKGYLWAPPGGGVEFGESIQETIQREFQEETGLKVSVGEFLFVNEFIGKSLHAIELFYEVEQTGGQLTRGIDPEIESINIIDQVEFKSLNDLQKEGEEYYHSSLKELF